MLQAVGMPFLGVQTSHFSVVLEPPKELGPVQFPSFLAGKEVGTAIGRTFPQPCRKSTFFVKQGLSFVGQERLYGLKAVFEPGNRQVAVLNIGLLNSADFAGSKPVLGSQEDYSPIPGGILAGNLQDRQQFFLCEGLPDIRHIEIASMWILCN
jgi:hypothetical protein